MQERGETDRRRQMQRGIGRQRDNGRDSETERDHDQKDTICPSSSDPFYTVTHYFCDTQYH